MIETCANGQELIQNTYCMSYHDDFVDLETAVLRCHIRGGRLAVPTDDFATIEFAEELLSKFTIGPS